MTMDKRRRNDAPDEFTWVQAKKSYGILVETIKLNLAELLAVPVAQCSYKISVQTLVPVVAKRQNG